MIMVRCGDDFGHRAAGVKFADIACPWELDLADGREPASWRVANRLRKMAAGILVPSFAKGARQDMYNLVLWKWGPDLPYRVTAHDPSGRLSKNRLS
jgi:RES domain-containing protein